MAATDEPASKKLKKSNPWMEAARLLPQLPPGIPRTRVKGRVHRAARRTHGACSPLLAWRCGQRRARYVPRVPLSRPRADVHAVKACRGKGGGTRGTHGPSVPDWPALEYPIGCRVKCLGFEGRVTAFDERSGFFTVACEDGEEREVFPFARVVRYYCRCARRARMLQRWATRGAASLCALTISLRCRVLQSRRLLRHLLRLPLTRQARQRQRREEKGRALQLHRHGTQQLRKSLKAARVSRRAARVARRPRSRSRSKRRAATRARTDDRRYCTSVAVITRTVRTGRALANSAAVASCRCTRQFGQLICA